MLRLMRQTAMKPAPAAALGLVALGGSLLVTQPLFGLPGYELSAALALALGLVGWIPAAQAVRLAADEGPKKVDAGILAGAALNLAALVPPLGVSLAYVTFSTRCSPFALFGFFPLLPLPSAVLAACVGAGLGLAFRRWRTTFPAALGLLLAWAAWSAWPLVFGPQVFVFNALGGYLPGPLYDETLKVTPALFWFRLETLAGAAALWLFLRARLGARRLWPAPLLLAVVLELLGPKLGTRMNDATVAQALGGERESEHFVLHYPKAKGGDELERMVRDLEFRHAQISRFLGGPPPGKVTVWWYASAEQKQALVGAGGTQFAKPWRREVHVDSGGFPHRVVKHELVHAMAAPFGAAPFGVTARLFGLLPEPGLIEGLAVAGDDPVDELTLHQWAAGMRAEQLLPDVRGLFTLGGFYAASPSRAYIAAGSFVRWLGDTRGGEKLRQLYRAGDFQGVYGVPLDTLATEWEGFLSGVVLDPVAKAQAFARFRRGSIFQRPCAREVAQLSEEAASLSGGDPLGSAALYAKCAALQPDEPGHVLAQARELEAGEQLDQARALLTQLAARKDAQQPALAAEVAMSLGDVAHAAGDEAQAQASFERVLQLEPGPAMERTAFVKLHGLLPGNQAVWGYFSRQSDEVKLAALFEGEADPYVQYLIGRRMALSGGPALAVKWLARALAGELPVSIEREARRLLVENDYLMGDCARVAADAADAPPDTDAYDAVMAEWRARCDFERAAFKGVLVPKGPLR